MDIKLLSGFSIGKIHLGLIKYLFNNAKKIDILNLYHFWYYTLFYAILFKILNKKGKVYLKLDQNISLFKSRGNRFYNINFFVNRFFRIFENMLINISDIISIEVEEGVQLLEQYNKRFIGKLYYVPNGFDDFLIDEENVDEIIKHKDNLMITVGRIGTLQKNTEMLLKVLEKLEFNGYKCKIVGPIEQDFQEKIYDFFEKNKHLTKYVEFMGPLSKSQTYKLYKKSKIFLLTSRWEGFPLVFPEALGFGNHIITTKVSGASDITNNGKIGDIIEINDIEKFYKILQERVDNPYINKKCLEAINYSKNFKWSIIVKRLPI